MDSQSKHLDIESMIKALKPTAIHGSGYSFATHPNLEIVKEKEGWRIYDFFAQDKFSSHYFSTRKEAKQTLVNLGIVKQSESMHKCKWSSYSLLDQVTIYGRAQTWHMGFVKPPSWYAFVPEWEGSYKSRVAALKFLTQLIVCFDKDKQETWFWSPQSL